MHYCFILASEIYISKHRLVFQHFVSWIYRSTHLILWNRPRRMKQRRRASIEYRDKSRCVRRRSPPPFYFPEISRLNLYVEPAGQKDDRSDRVRCARERASGRAIALSLIFSDWLAGLPIWPITDELRGISESKLHGRRDDQIRARARQEL